jgi:hypothetical protein
VGLQWDCYKQGSKRVDAVRLVEKPCHLTVLPSTVLYCFCGLADCRFLRGGV